MTARPRGALVMPEWTFRTQFDAARLARLSRLTHQVAPAAFTGPGGLDDPDATETLAGVEVLVTSWGSPRLTRERLDRLPRLRAVFHCAGTVRDIVSESFWERDLIITTAADANAVPVAEFAFASIVLAGKRGQYLARVARAHASSPGDVDRSSLGNHHGAVGIVGFSRIGRRVIQMLAQLSGTRVLVADPYARPEDVAELGAELLPLDELLPRVRVLSIHAPELPETRHLIGAAELAELPDGATVVNTARGSLIDHNALIEHCRHGRLDAVLDVTEPEPLPADSPLLDMPNVSVTPHIAGSTGPEARLLVDSALEELEAYVHGETLRHRLLRAEFERTA